MSKAEIFTRLLSAAAAAPLLIATPAAAQATNDKFTDVQKLGYLGKLSKNKVVQAARDQLVAETTAPALATPADRVFFWTDVLLDTIALDHTPGADPVGTGADLPPFYQGGPTRTSRALAMTSIAIFDATNAFGRPYAPYNKFSDAKDGASMDVAIAYAAHDVLIDLFPWRADVLDDLLASDLVQTGLSSNSRAYKDGQQVGENAAEAILKARNNDKSKDPEPSFGDGGRVADGNKTYRGGKVNDGSMNVYDWTPDPNTPEFDALNFNVSLGAYWGAVTPFAMSSGDQFRLPPYPAPGTPEFVDAFNLTAARGGSPDNVNTTSTSTPETRENGNFWGYDAVPLLGTPPRHYVQIAIDIINQEMDCETVECDATDVARKLAMINVGQADAGIGAWDSKYYYNYWRPVTGVRNPDGDPTTNNDPTWDPVGVSIVNVELPDGEGFIRPTPPFPAYPSGHSTFGAVSFTLLAAFFGDDTPFDNVSDEYNGVSVDPFDDQPRPLVIKHFNSFSDAQISNGASRIDNGVHWSYDDLQGQGMGENIANLILNDIDAFQPN